MNTSALAAAIVPAHGWRNKPPQCTCVAVRNGAAPLQRITHRSSGLLSPGWLRQSCAAGAFAAHTAAGAGRHQRASHASLQASICKAGGQAECYEQAIQLQLLDKLQAPCSVRTAGGTAARKVEQDAVVGMASCDMQMVNESAPALLQHWPTTKRINFRGLPALVYCSRLPGSSATPSCSPFVHSETLRHAVEHGRLLPERLLVLSVLGYARLIQRSVRRPPDGS